MHLKSLLRGGVVLGVFLLAMVHTVRADTDHLPPGYSIRLISTGVTANLISQMAFKPGDLTHVYAGRDTQSRVTRYDFNPVTGLLTNAITVATNTDHKELIGIGFHGGYLYVTFDYGGTKTVAPGDGRIARYFNPNA